MSSILPSPATHSLDLGLWSACAPKLCILRRFRVFWISLQALKVGNFGENLPKVSSPSAQYSRFWETLSGDFFDLHCVVGVVANFGVLPPLNSV